MLQEDAFFSPIHVNPVQLFSPLICLLFFISNIVLAAPADDFIKAIKSQLPKYQIFDSLEMKNIETKGNAAMSIMQAELLIKVRAKENLYRMQSYKNGKYELVLSVKKGDVSQRNAVGMTLPAMAGMGKVRVIMLPDTSANAAPLSKYKKGTYTIVTADTPKNTKDITTTAVPITNSASIKKPVLNSVPVTSAQQPAPSARNNNIALTRIMGIYNAQGAVYGVLPVSLKGAPIILKKLKKNSDGSLSGYAEYPVTGVVHPFTLTSQSVQVVLQEKAAIKKGGIPTQPATYQMVVKGDMLMQYGMPKFPLTLAENKALKDKQQNRGAPWKSLNELPNYLLVGNMLWDIEKMKVVNPNWMKGPVAPVKGLEQYFLSTDNQYFLTVKPFGAVDRNISANRGGNAGSVAPLSGLTGNAWISSDYKHFVQFKNGDVWSGQLDWKYNTYKNLTNKTNIGLLNNIKLISWYKDNIYLKRENAGDKPILRVNINTGKLDELKDNPAFNGKHGSPDGRFVFSSDTRTGILHVYDAAKKEFFDMRASFNQRIYGGELEEDEVPVDITPRSWKNEYTFNVFYSYGTIGWYDLKSRKRFVLTDIPQIAKDLPAVTRVLRMNHLPDADYIDVYMSGSKMSTTGQADRANTIKKRYLINLKTKTAKVLPLTHLLTENMYSVTWLDTQKYVYAIDKGGLNDIGTWLYDTKTKKTKRLSALVRVKKTANGSSKNLRFTKSQYSRFKIPAYEENDFKIIPARKEIAYCTQAGNKMQLVLVSYDTGKIKKAPITNKKMYGCSLSQILPYEVVVN